MSDFVHTFQIATPKGMRRIGPGEPAFIVAEMSGNHNQNFDTAVKIVQAAAAAGADAIKLQTYTADTITIDCNKPCFRDRGEHNPELWQGKTLYDLYTMAYTPWDWQPKLQKIAEELGLVFFSTPFDNTSVDFLEGLHVPCYKISSYEANDIELLKKIASTGKPVIMSVGFSELLEIEESVKALRDAGVQDLALLHCLTSYSDVPDYSTAHLATMLDLQEKFDVMVGLSDNNGGIELAVTSVSMGASVVEKHFILKSENNGPDARFSLTEEGLQEMVRRIREVETMQGTVAYGPRSEMERENLRFRRSLFVVKDMKKGESFTGETVRSIRPHNGLPPKYYTQVLGKTAATDIERGTPLAWDLITEK